MPVMSYLALDDKSRLARSDFVRLGLVTRPGEPGMLPYSESFLRDFETRHCYDRYWEQTGRTHDWPDTRFLCSGHAFTVIVDANDEFCVDQQSGVLSQFRHQHFLLGLIAHFQKAALLMLRDRLVVAMTQMDLRDVESVRAFKRSIRHTKEIFLRFTHRYWFHEISDQALARDLYRLWAGQLGTDVLYNEVRNEILDMTEYLDSDQVRRQAETVVRLTVVTVLGLIFNIVTGWFGMNLLAAADEPLAVKTVLLLRGVHPCLGADPVHRLQVETPGLFPRGHGRRQDSCARQAQDLPGGLAAQASRRACAWRQEATQGLTSCRRRCPSGGARRLLAGEHALRSPWARCPPADHARLERTESATSAVSVRSDRARG